MYRTFSTSESSSNEAVEQEGVLSIMTDVERFEEEGFLSCSICFNLYDEQDRLPKSLPCHHSYCHSCVLKLTSSGFAPCPECYRPFQVTDCKNNQEVIRNMRLWKSNKEMKMKEIKSRSIDCKIGDSSENARKHTATGSSSINGNKVLLLRVVQSNMVPVCEFCEESTTEVICQDCSKLKCLCEQCFDIRHHKKAAFIEHKNVLRVSDATDIVCCPQHPGSLCDSYCGECCVPLCTQCMSPAVRSECVGKMSTVAASNSNSSFSSFSSSFSCEHINHVHVVCNIGVEAERCKTFLSQKLAVLASSIEDSTTSLQSAEGDLPFFTSGAATAELTSQIHTSFDTLRASLLNLLSRREQELVDTAAVRVHQEAEKLASETEAWSRRLDQAKDTYLQMKSELSSSPRPSITVIQSSTGLLQQLEEAIQEISTFDQLIKPVAVHSSPLLMEQQQYGQSLLAEEARRDPSGSGDERGGVTSASTLLSRRGVVFRMDEAGSISEMASRMGQLTDTIASFSTEGGGAGVDGDVDERVNPCASNNGDLVSLLMSEEISSPPLPAAAAASGDCISPDYLPRPRLNMHNNSALRRTNANTDFSSVGTGTGTGADAAGAAGAGACALAEASGRTGMRSTSIESKDTRYSRSTNSKSIKGATGCGSYHPGQYATAIGCWTCCDELNETHTGCQFGAMLRHHPGERLPSISSNNNITRWSCCGCGSPAGCRKGRRLPLFASSSVPLPLPPPPPPIINYHLSSSTAAAAETEGMERKVGVDSDSHYHTGQYTVSLYGGPDCMKWSCCGNANESCIGCMTGSVARHHTGHSYFRSWDCCRSSCGSDGCAIGRHPNPFPRK